MLKIRDNEPGYAKLNDPESDSVNRYGKSIDLLKDSGLAESESFRINGDDSVGDNPNRYKQHGFFFTADNCIGCHACEAACSEKNDLPDHIAFRSVGYVESGSYPSYNRMNISMACNHCDDPVCLKGCPTRAYTKFAEYGAVLQDPDICFGCGYCTWVCPYNAPQLDPVKGSVSKCNMCVDRLEVGLKPACVSACLGNALDFGVIENTPENREQSNTTIPGFPNPEITQPNIRFQITRSLERVFKRPDNSSVKYKKDGKSGEYLPAIDDSKKLPGKNWNFKDLLTSHENAHIAFTLCTQMVMGVFLLSYFGPWLGLQGTGLAGETLFMPLMLAAFTFMTYGMLRLNLHLGKPLRFYRGFNNLRHSPVSREIAGVSLFFMGLSGYVFFGLVGYNGFFGAGDGLFGMSLSTTQILTNIMAFFTVIGGVVGLFYMVKLYLIKARPFWNHWQTATSFVGTLLSLGGVLMLAVSALFYTPAALSPLLPPLAGIIFLGLVLEAIGLVFHAGDLRHSQDEGVVSHFEQTTTYGKSYLLRNGLLGFAMLLSLAIAVWGLPTNLFGMTVGLVLSLAILTSAILGRALFFVLVIPTTMPGASFWKNKGFEKHAQESGLAAEIPMGVLPDHPSHFPTWQDVKDVLAGK